MGRDSSSPLETLVTSKKSNMFNTYSCSTSESVGGIIVRVCACAVGEMATSVRARRNGKEEGGEEEEEPVV